MLRTIFKESGEGLELEGNNISFLLPFIFLSLFIIEKTRARLESAVVPPTPMVRPDTRDGLKVAG